MVFADEIWTLVFPSRLILYVRYSMDVHQKQIGDGSKVIWVDCGDEGNDSHRIQNRKGDAIHGIPLG